MSDEDILSAFEQRLQELVSFVDDSLAKLQGNEMPDMADLDVKVSGLCQDIETADSETAQQLQPLMSEMIGKLDELAQALSEFQARAQEE